MQDSWDNHVYLEKEQSGGTKTYQFQSYYKLMKSRQYLYRLME